MENGNISLENLEQERKKIYKKSIILIIIIILFIVAGVGLFFIWSFVSFTLFIIAIGLIFLNASIVKKFKETFKDSVVKKLITEELGVDAKYSKKGGIPIAEINSLKLAKTPDRYREEDYITCTYNGIPYEMCDCVLEERVVRRDAHGHHEVTYESYFKGRAIKIDFKRNLNMQLKVVNSPAKGFSAGNLVSFETEVIEFNKKFKCYADTKENGFYLLTPMMIQKMLELEKLYRGGIYYAVMNNNFYILINNNGDSLEVNISKPLDQKQLDRIRSDILIGASIIHEFRMDKDKFNVDR